jgi:hypothetical protein
MSLSKHHLYILKGSNIPNLFYSPIINGSCLDNRLNSDNSVVILISEENLIRILEGPESDLVKIKSIIFLKEILNRYNLMRYKADLLERNQRWVGFSRKNLESLFGSRDTDLVIENLLSLGLIERDNIYSVSEGKTLAYRLTPKTEEKPEKWRVKYTGKLIARVNNKESDSLLSQDNNLFNQAVYRNLKTVTLSESAEELAKKFGGNDFFAAYAHLTEIESGNIFFKEDKKSGRRFHNLTCMPRQSRSAILIDGEPTTEVDFSACHPWLCLSFYESGFEKEKREYHAALNEGFYKFLAKKIGSDISTDEKYQKFKIGCIAQIFYDYPRQNDSSKLAAFKQLFPHLHEIIESEKHISNSDFSIKLQGMEADLMFDGVFFRLLSEDIPAIPIHDAVICKKRHAGRVRLIMEQEFITKYGYRPEVKIKT